MTAFFRAIVIWVALSLPLAQAIDQTGWNDRERAVWVGASDFLERASLLHPPQYRRYYPFEAALSEEDIAQAWEQAKQPHAGPIYMNAHVDGRSVYILTKLHTTHPLVAQAWRLNDGLDKDAYLFWKVWKPVARRQVTQKLLGVEVKTAGLLTPQIMTIDEAVLRAARGV
ncbi:uncharacterized protein UTRI_10391_B [Ustilago trichophora]|uniref:Uncharacterized protein n=1 Tax=Ustilago trichophora TaxID=86804 RepID=A0A5C3E8P8_9BASI|nr:uncharacterized protein UTRI_10391_B [Ustilago trichophora]